MNILIIRYGVISNNSAFVGVEQIYEKIVEEGHNITIIKSSDDIYESKKLKVHSINKFLFKPLKKFRLPLSMALLSSRYRSSIHQADFVIVQDPKYFTYFWVDLLFLIFKRKKFIIELSVIQKFINLNLGFISKQIKKFSIMNLFFRKCHKVFAITPFAAKVLPSYGDFPINYYSNKLVFTGHPVSRYNFEIKKKRDNKIRILSIGRLIDEKGYLEIFTVLGIFDKLNFDFVFHIYGGGPLKDFLLTIVEKYHLQNRIVFFDSLEHKILLEKIPSYDLFVLFQKQTPNWQEYFGLAALEAASRGLYVLTTDLPGQFFALKGFNEKVYFVKENSMSSLRDNIEICFNKILNNPLSLDQIDSYQEFTIEQIKEKMINSMLDK